MILSDADVRALLLAYVNSTLHIPVDTIEPHDDDECTGFILTLSPRARQQKPRLLERFCERIRNWRNSRSEALA